MREDEYDGFLWKRIEKFSFFYPLSQVWKTNPIIRKVISVLWILSVLGVGFILYVVLGNKPITENSSLLSTFTIVVVLVLLSIVAIIYILFDKCKFNAGIYSKWIEIELWWCSFEELKWVKLYQYSENWDEYVKLIYTEFDDSIKTETLLYNPKMDKFLEKIQEAFQNNGISCEKISDLRGIDISDPIEYKAYFWFLNVWRLLSWKEKWEKVKGFCITYLCVLILLWIWVFNRRFSIDEIKSGIPAFLIMARVLLAFLIIYFIFAIKKFYARKENNTVCIHNTVLSKTYVLSKIKANYWIITEWNLEWIMLTVNDGGKTSKYKRPKNVEVERFCNDLLDEIRKRKEW